MHVASLLTAYSCLEKGKCVVKYVYARTAQTHAAVWPTCFDFVFDLLPWRCIKHSEYWHVCLLNLHADNLPVRRENWMKGRGIRWRNDIRWLCKTHPSSEGWRKKVGAGACLDVFPVPHSPVHHPCGGAVTGITWAAPLLYGVASRVNCALQVSSRYLLNVLSYILGCTLNKLLPLVTWILVVK